MPGDSTMHLNRNRRTWPWALLSILVLLPLALGQSSAGGCGATVTVPDPDPDSDGDGFTDDVEINGTPGTDPNDPTDNPNNVRDSDGDGCSDFDEINFLGFCDQNPFTTPCPFELDDGQGFSVTIPCGFVPVDSSLVPLPAASYQQVYTSIEHVILVAVFPTTQGAGTLPDQFGTLQLNGPVTTASGDFLLSENYQASGYEGERVTGLLANGNFLIIGVLGASYDQNVQAIAGAMLPTIDLTDTDGSAYFDLLASVASELLVRPAGSVTTQDAYLVLDDDSVWYVKTDTDALLASWTAGDLILVTSVQDYLYSDGTLVNISNDWRFAGADLIGTGTHGVIAGFNDPDFGATEIILERGSVLESSYTDESKLSMWQVGDPVIVVIGGGVYGDVVINLRTGQAVSIS